jgi:hypothetical protein
MSFQFYHLKLGYQTLSFVIFFTFYSMGYRDLISHVFIKLTQVDAGYHRLNIFFMLEKI